MHRGKVDPGVSELSRGNELSRDHVNRPLVKQTRALEEYRRHKPSATDCVPILAVWCEIKTTFTRDRICSDPFGIESTLVRVRIHSVYTGPVL